MPIASGLGLVVELYHNFLSLWRKDIEVVTVFYSFPRHVLRRETEKEHCK